MLVTDADARQHAVLDDLGVELAGSPFSHSPFKDQADPVRTAHIQVIADDVLNQSPSLGWVAKDQGLAHFDLPDTQLMPIAGCPILGIERPRQLFDPVVEKSLDLAGG